jgi:hypothetical protein
MTISKSEAAALEVCNKARRILGEPRASRMEKGSPGSRLSCSICNTVGGHVRISGHGIVGYFLSAYAPSGQNVASIPIEGLALRWLNRFDGGRIKRLIMGSNDDR